MKKFTFNVFILACFLFVAGNTYAAEIVVESGGDLQAAIDGATSGDVIVLADGGEYTATASLAINGKDITIKAVDGAAVKPLLNIKEFTIAGTGNALELSGLKIDGGLSSYVVYFLDSNDSTRSVNIHDCEIANFARSLIRGDKSPSGANRMICDSILVNNIVVSNVGVDNGSYQTFLMKSAFKADFISITNSTFDNCDGGFFRDENSSEVKKVVIDHCTLNDVMKNTGKNLIISKGAEGASLTISNCIITNLPDLTYWKMSIPENTFTNSAYSGIANDAKWNTDSTWTTISEVNMVDPGYVDAENGDFTVTNTALLEAGTDGGLIGDPRWAPEASPWKMYTGDALPDASTPAFSESNTSGDQVAVNTIEVDPNNAGNSLLKLSAPGVNSKHMWKYNFENDPQNDITIVARVKGTSHDIQRTMEFDIQQAGFRERLYIKNDTTFELKESGVTGDLPADPVGWHIYRITKSGDQLSFYFDEDPTAVASVTTTTTSGSNYFRFGDGNGGSTLEALVDWVIWDESGAYAPGAGTAIPASLITDITTASRIINRASEMSFYPNPATNKVYVKVNQPTKVGIYGLTGRLMRSKKIDAINDFINISDLPTGIYLLRSMDRNDFAKKLIIQQ